MKGPTDTPDGRLFPAKLERRNGREKRAATNRIATNPCKTKFYQHRVRNDLQRTRNAPTAHNERTWPTTRPSALINPRPGFQPPAPRPRHTLGIPAQTAHLRFSNERKVPSNKILWNSTTQRTAAHRERTNSRRRRTKGAQVLVPPWQTTFKSTQRPAPAHPVDRGDESSASAASARRSKKRAA